MKPLIKWPGGKSGEISIIEKYIPKYNRYIEPFFGGGAVFFHLQPKLAMINDISEDLIKYYSLIKQQDKQFYDLLLCYNNSFSNMVQICDDHYSDILNIYNIYSCDEAKLFETKTQLSLLIQSIADKINSSFSEKLLLEDDLFISSINKSVLDKIKRTYKNNQKRSFSMEDMRNNLITGFTSGYYMYFRDVYNSIKSKKKSAPSIQYEAANFYFIREYCYGSMFRYNSKGEFNIPYGGMSYNRKNMKIKIENMFNREIGDLFANTEICCSDFESFLKRASLTDNDFVFLDPPYDTEFSDYDGRDFTQLDQERLAYFLKKTAAQILLVIKNTDFIKKLYEKDFNILSFDKQYTYNVKSRNERCTEHLIITNFSV